MKPTAPPPADWGGVSIQGFPVQRSIFAIGDVLNDVYEIRGVLGSGGNGQVFDAYDRMLSRRVAIKAAWDEQKKRGPLLRKEAQALAAIRHPALVAVYAMGVHDGVEYMVMEHVPGVTLEDYLERRRDLREQTPLLEALDILIAVAEGLAAVHRGGIAHRDIKPGNIMLAPGNRVVLTDFGLMLPELEVGHVKDVRGTPMYMAPEAIRNEMEPGEAHLVDIYALGALAFELVAGAPPFDAASVPALLRKHLEEPVPEVPNAPRKLAALIREMLAKDPHGRPQQLEGVVWRLRALRTDATAPEAAATFRVLVVDDDPAIAKLIGAYVKQAVPGAEVILANGPREALEAARKKEPRLIILDLMMPEMNGVELFMVLRGERLAEKATVVAVSAGARDADVELLYELGVSHFVAKGPELRPRITEIAKDVHGLVAPSTVPASKTKSRRP